jgi:hypothetical protein
MWLKTTDSKDKEQAPEKLRYSRYYEHDGALRAYANRAMLLAFICVPTALLAVALAAYVRLQPPTVIRVDSTGSATVLGDKTGAAKPILVSQGTNAEPNDFEKNAYVRLFLDRYLSFSPDSVNRNCADETIFHELISISDCQLSARVLTELRSVPEHEIPVPDPASGAFPNVGHNREQSSYGDA